MRIRMIQARAWWQPLCGCLGLALTILPYAAVAQQSTAAQRKPPEPQAATARPAQQADDPEPAVDTSAETRAAGRPRADDRGATTRADARSGGDRHASDARAHGKAMDHLQLGTTDITGNRELPKVMYIVPWKHSELGDLTGKPLNSLIDQTLQPVDRDVFRRENAYYRAVAGDRAAAGTGARAAAAGAAQGATGGAAHGAAGSAAHDAARSAGGGGGQPARDER